MSTTLFAWADFEAEAADPANHIPFDPVPRARARRRGWSEERQRAFIFALSRCGSVARAARAAGMSARSVYQLLDSPGADSFARAWDQAVEEGIARVRADALQRSLGGAFVPVFRRGRLVRVEHRRCDRLAIALLSGKDRSIDDYRRTAVARREYRAELRALDASRAEEARRAEEVWAQHQAVLDRIEAERARPRPSAPPRVRSL